MMYGILCCRCHTELKRAKSLDDMLKVTSFNSFETNYKSSSHISDSDLFKIRKDEINLKKKSCENRLVCSNKFNVNSPNAVHENENIVKYLLDLDDYLKKSEKPNSLNKLPIFRANSIPHSVQHQNFSKTETLLEGNFHKSKIVLRIEAISISGTWSKRRFKYCSDQEENGVTTITNNILYSCIGKKKRVFASEFLKDIRSLRFQLKKKFANNRGLKFLTYEEIFQNLIEQRLFGKILERAPIFSPLVTNSSQSVAYFNRKNIGWISDSVSINIPEDASNNEKIAIISEESVICNESCTGAADSRRILESVCGRNIREDEEDNSTPMDREIMDTVMKTDFNTLWLDNCSRLLALISCTLGLFNINRFAVLTIIYGQHFLIQFLLLSILFGIPILWLQMSLGAKIKEGPISMWKISPICIGIGIAITLVQYFITIYSSISLVWIFIYIQDIFINKSSYPWLKPIHNQKFSYIYANLTEDIADYFNINVLQRIHARVLKAGYESQVGFHINGRIALYLILLWAIVFLIFHKGLKSLGKFLSLLGLLPIIFLVAITVKLLCVTDFMELQNMLSSFNLNDFLVNSEAWAAAAQETFLTWGIFGASIIIISSQTSTNYYSFELRKEAILVAIITLIGLCLSAVIGLCSLQILRNSGYIYIPGSYETTKQYSEIFSVKSVVWRDVIFHPNKYVTHYSSLVGEVYKYHTVTENVSGYHVLRFVTEILPAVITTSTDKISWIWILLIYFTFLLFGLLQLFVTWKPIACALENSSLAVLMSCVTGLLLSIPFASETGITFLYCFDMLLGGAWFIPVLWCTEIFGVFLIRGPPYNGDDLVNNLKMTTYISGYLALSWNILLPFGLIILAIIEYKILVSNQLYYCPENSDVNYWLREVAVLTQIGFLILIPISAVVQICRYLSAGPSDILVRIQMLYRPLDYSEGNQTNNQIDNNICSVTSENTAIEGFQHDIPPTYTPPPSYSTATGVKIAKILRQSFKRNVRRNLEQLEKPRLVLTNFEPQQCEEVRFPSQEISIRIS